MTEIDNASAAPAAQDGAENQGQPQDNVSNQAATWFDSFEPTERGFIENKGWGNKDAKPEEVLKNTLKSYQELEKFRGASPEELIKLPKADDAEGWKKVYQRLGQPESPDKYSEFQMPEGRQANPDLVKSFREIAHGAGLNDAQQKAIAEGYAGLEAKMVAAANEARKAEFDTEMMNLKGEWKGQFDERKELAKRAGQSLGLAEGEIDLLSEAWGAAKAYKFLAKIGDATQEGGRVTGDTKKDFGISPDAAKQKLEEITARPDFFNILKNQNSAEYREYQRYNYIANGGDELVSASGN